MNSARFKNLTTVSLAILGSLVIVFVAPIGIDGQSWFERISSEPEPTTTLDSSQQAAPAPFGMTGGDFVATQNRNPESRVRRGQFGSPSPSRMAETRESETGLRVARDWLNDDASVHLKLEPIGKPIRNDYVVE